jgi:hypothetical protein
MINPAPIYDSRNEAQFRLQAEQRYNRAVTTERAAPFLLITDQDTQEVYKLTIETGAIVLTVVA